MTLRFWRPALVVATAAFCAGTAVPSLAAAPDPSAENEPTECCTSPWLDMARAVYEMTQTGELSPGGVTETVTGTCAGKAGVTEGFNADATWAVVAEAHATSDHPFVQPLATGVICDVRNRETGESYGIVSGGLSGGHALAANQVVIPSGALVAVCVVASSTFSDGRTVTSSTGC